MGQKNAFILRNLRNAVTKVRIHEKELALLGSREIFMIKKEAGEKIESLLLELRDGILDSIPGLKGPFPEGCDLIQGKITRGENYKGFPYRVLDFPRKFSKEDLFTFRTMFWYGHGFSFHLQGGGKSNHDLRKLLSTNITRGGGREFFLGTGEHPFDYDFESGNFVKSGEIKSGIDLPQSYFKISAFLETESWEKVPEKGTLILREMLALLQEPMT